MAIKSQKDFFSGLLFTAVGAAFAVGASSYSIGTGARMGPGYFPLILGICMAILGAIITFKSLVVESVDGQGDKIGSWAWRPLFFIIAANLMFGVLFAGLPSFSFPAFGLIFAIFALVAVASMADKANNFVSIWGGGLIGLLLGASVVKVIAPFFVSLLSPFQSLASVFNVTKGFTYSFLMNSPEVAGRLLAYALIAYLVIKYLPVKKDTREYAVLTFTLIALSVWSFVNLLNLQFPVWPSFLTK